MVFVVLIGFQACDAKRTRGVAGKSIELQRIQSWREPVSVSGRFEIRRHVSRMDKLKEKELQDGISESLKSAIQKSVVDPNVQHALSDSLYSVSRRAFVPKWLHKFSV